MITSVRESLVLRIKKEIDVLPVLSVLSIHRRLVSLQSLPKTFEPIEQKQTFLIILDSLENIESPSPLVNVVTYLQPPRDRLKHSRCNLFLLSTTLRGGGGEFLVITVCSFSPSKHGYWFKVFGKDCSWCQSTVQEAWVRVPAGPTLGVLKN